MPSIQQYLNGAPMDDLSKNALRILINSLRTDVATLRTNFAVVTAKLDADATVTDTNYGALSAGTPTTTE